MPQSIKTNFSKIIHPQAHSSSTHISNINVCSYSVITEATHGSSTLWNRSPSVKPAPWLAVLQSSYNNQVKTTSGHQFGQDSWYVSLLLSFAILSNWAPHATSGSTIELKCSRRGEKSKRHLYILRYNHGVYWHATN